MEDFPVKIADLLESVAAKVRTMTVDRLAGYARWGTAGLVIAFLAFLLLIFLLIGLFRLVGELITYEGAYAAFGGLFVLIGLLLWGKRNPKPGDT